MLMDLMDTRNRQAVVIFVRLVIQIFCVAMLDSLITDKYPRQKF